MGFPKAFLPPKSLRKSAVSFAGKHGAIAGAAVGTAVLGPGFGTTVGGVVGGVAAKGAASAAEKKLAGGKAKHKAAHAATSSMGSTRIASEESPGDYEKTRSKGGIIDAILRALGLGG